LSWFFTKKPRQKAIIYAASAFVFFSCIADSSAFFFFLFSFGKYFKQKKTITMSNANDHIQTGNGSENFYCHRPSLILYTDGVKDIAEACQAYWLIDLIISHQCKKAVNLERFQVWELKREKADKFFVKATDGNNNPVASQKIPFSDFPYDLATIWLVDGCIMLPTEY
jgi:hypothetical protein